MNRLEEYPFSSYKDYLYGGNLVDTGFAIKLTGRDEWIRLHQIETDDVLEISGKQRLDDSEIRRRILQYTNGYEPHEIGSWEKADRDAMLRRLKESGISIR